MKRKLKNFYKNEKQFNRNSENFFTVILFLIISIPVLGCLSSCGGGLPSGSEQTKKHLPVDMNSYSVSYPVGDDWQCDVKKGIGMITFTRDKSSTSSDIMGVLVGGGPKGSTVIDIYENRIVSDTFNLGEKETAEDFMNNELKDMKKKGVKKGLYELEDITKSDTVINGKKFYCMKYELSKIRNDWGAYLNSQSMLALYFPVNYLEVRKFYVFLINDYSNSISIGQDAGQLYPVLASFKLKNEVL